MAYILLQRGDNNDPAERWQCAINSMPPGVFSRPNFLNSAEALQLLQHMNRFYQIPNFDPMAQHSLLWSQLTPQLDSNGYVSQAQFLRLLSVQPHVQQHVW